MLETIFCFWSISGVLSWGWANKFITETNNDFVKNEYKIAILLISPISGPILAFVLVKWGLEIKNGGFHFGLKFW